MTTAAPMNAVLIRHATDADICVLADLAVLDSRPALTGPALIAEVQGVPRAALDLRDGSVAADPFAATADLVELLRMHAKSITPKSSPADALRRRLTTWTAPLTPRARA